MKNFKLLLIVSLGAMLFTQCSKEDDLKEDIDAATLKGTGRADAVPGAKFMVQIENVSTPYPYFAAGAQFIPDGEASPGPAFPGQSFTVQFHAGKGHKLSFASMYGASNDLFFAPDGEGISLFTGDLPTTGNITGLISLWDAGTEENHAPASG